MLVWPVPELLGAGLRVLSLGRWLPGLVLARARAEALGQSRLEWAARRSFEWALSDLLRFFRELRRMTRAMTADLHRRRLRRLHQRVESQRGVLISLS